MLSEIMVINGLYSDQEPYAGVWTTKTSPAWRVKAYEGTTGGKSAPTESSTLITVMMIE